MPYVPLHVHSINSPFRGMITPEELVAASARKGFGAAALTDCWNTYGHYSFYRAAGREGLKPVLGIEARHLSLRGRKNAGHLTLLAQNNTGYRNIVSIAEAHYLKKNGRYVTEEELREYSSGIIALTGSTEGEICQSLIGGSLTGMKNILEELAGIFGPDQLYIELINHNTDIEWFLCDKLIELSERTGIPSVVTNNDRFISRDAARDYLVLEKIGDKYEKRRHREGGSEYFLKTRQELEPYFTTAEKALDATTEIAERCNVELPDEFYLQFTDMEDPGRELERRCNKYFRLKCRGVDAPLKEKIERSIGLELEMAGRGKASSFLIFLSSLFRRCRRRLIRLEVIGDELQQSVIAYLLGITNVEPLSHSLIFECFCQEGTDYSPYLELITNAADRNQVFREVCSIIPDCRIFHRVVRTDMSFRKIVEELCSVVEVDKRLRERIISLASGDGSRMDISSMFRDSAAFRDLYGRDRNVKRIFHLASLFRGRITHFNMDSSHAVVLPEGAEEMIPVLQNQEGERFLQCDDDTIELLGGWPFILHHSRVLEVISLAMGEVEHEIKGERALEELMTLEDRETFELISSGDTIGVYLLESPGVRKMISRIKPGSFDSFVDAISLYRPAPLRGGLWKKYIGEEPVDLPPLRSIEKILSGTGGVLLYREQIREIIEHISGLKGEDVYIMERSLYRGDPGGLRSSRLNFIRNSIELGKSEEVGNAVFDYLAESTAYTYARSLACSRAYLSYVSAYLKTHHPDHFFAALLNVYSGEERKFSAYRKAYEESGGQVLSSDVNRSFESFVLEDDGIRSPLLRGEEYRAGSIVMEREKRGAFGSLADFIKRMEDIKEDILLNMAENGLFDSFGGDRKEIESELLELFEERKIKMPEYQRKSRKADEGEDLKQLSIFDDNDRFPENR